MAATQIKLAQGIKELEKNENTFLWSHGENKGIGIDTIFCFGKNEWSIDVECKMGSYGMFIDAWLLDLGNDVIGFVQLYEHSRGGHTDPTISIIKFDGTLIGIHYQYAGDMFQAAYSKDKLWILHKDHRLSAQQDRQKYSGTLLMEMDLTNAQVNFHKPLYLPQNFSDENKPEFAWLQSIGLSGYSIKFINLNDSIYLSFALSNYQRAATKEYSDVSIPLIEFL